MQPHHIRTRPLLGYVLLISLFVIAMVTMPTHGATWPSIAFDSYQAADGSYTPLSCGTASGTACPPIPVGSTLKIVVFVGLDNCDPVTLAYGDGTSDQVNLGGSAGHDFYHNYKGAGDYKITASFNACSGGQPSAQAAITVGGGTPAPTPDILSYAASVSVPAATSVGVIFGLASIGLALAPLRRTSLYVKYSADRLKPYVKEVADLVSTSFPGITGIGGFNDRDIAGKPGVKSQHAKGLALDFMVQKGDIAHGQPIADWLVERASSDPLIQYIIWNQKVWSRQRGWHDYTENSQGHWVDPHVDHVHVDWSSP